MTSLSALLAAAAVTAAAAASASRPLAASNRAVLYVEGMFDNSYSRDQMLADAREVAASGFEVAILAFLHYTPSGKCPQGAVYNDICFSDAAVLPDVMTILRGKDSSVKQVLLSIGGAGCESDFDHIGSSWASFQKDFPALISSIGLDGFDIDIETDLGPYMGTLVQLVQLGASLNYTVTACPAPGLTRRSDWVDLVKATKSARYDGSSGVSYLLLQTYGGGEAQYVQSYADAMSALVPDTATFVGPGGQVGGGWGPSEAGDMVRNSLQVLPGMTTAMIWDYRSIKLGFNPSHTNATEWGSSINAALSAGSDVPAAAATQALRGKPAPATDDGLIEGVPAELHERTARAARARYAERAARNRKYLTLA